MRSEMKINLKSEAYDDIVALFNWIDACPACVSNNIVERINEDIMELFYNNSSGGDDVYALETEGCAGDKLFALTYDQDGCDVVVAVTRGMK